MTRAPDDRDEARAPLAAAPQVLVVGADAALLGLLEEWLAPLTGSVRQEGSADAPPERCDLIVVDVPFPRQGGMETLKRLAQQHPNVPVLALSSSFFAAIESAGAVARALGVASVLPKPVRRDAFMAAVRHALHAAR